MCDIYESLHERIVKVTRGEFVCSCCKMEYNRNLSEEDDAKVVSYVQIGIMIICEDCLAYVDDFIMGNIREIILWYIETIENRAKEIEVERGYIRRLMESMKKI